MKKENYILTFALLVLAQILICNYLNLSQYIMLTLLPVAILCLPISYGCIGSMLIAFVSGLCVDFLAESVIGLNALALVPVALLRFPVISLVFGREVFARNENISVRQHGALKMTTAIIIVQSLFLLIYIWADGAWAYPFAFNLAKFFCSLGAGSILSIIIAIAIRPESSNKWK